MKKILTFVVCCLLGVVKVSALENDSHVTYSYIDNIYSNRQIGEQFYTGKQGVVYVNNKIAYCLDPTILLENDIYSSSGDFSRANISAEQLNYLEIVSYFGYMYQNRGDSKYYLATQEIIWEYITGGEVYWTNGKGGEVVSIESYKQEILKDVARYMTVPNLPSYSETYKGIDIVLEDSNHVLEYYDTDTFLGTIEEGKLRLNADYNGTVTVHLTKRPLNYETSYVYVSENSQTLATFGYSGTNESSIDITYRVIALTQIQFVKKDSSSNEIIKNRETKIKIYDVTRGKYIVENENDIFTIGSSGTFETATFLEEGEYRIEEISAPVGYKKLTEPQTFNIYEYHGPITQVEIYNEPYLYSIEINKKGELYDGLSQIDSKISGLYHLEAMNNVVYGVFAKENIINASGDILYAKDTLVTNIYIQNGFGVASNLPYGMYYLKELECPKEYVLDKTITEIQLSHDEYVSYDFINRLKKGTITIQKVDGTLGLKGAQFMLKGTNYPYSIHLESDNFGYIAIENIPYDTYWLKETKAPIGYVKEKEPKELILNDSFLHYTFENQKSETEIEPPKEEEKEPVEPEPPKEEEKEPVEPEPPKEEEKEPVEPEPPKEEEKEPVEPEPPKEEEKDLVEPEIPEAESYLDTIVPNPDTAVVTEYKSLLLHIVLCINLVLHIFKHKS